MPAFEDREIKAWVAEAAKEAKEAYEFCPGSYTYSAYSALLKLQHRLAPLRVLAYEVETPKR